MSYAATNGTSLSCHVNNCKLIAKFHEVGDMILDAEGRLRNRKFDPKVNHEILAEMMITHCVPFNFVECRAFRKYQKNWMMIVPLLLEILFPTMFWNLIEIQWKWNPSKLSCAHRVGYIVLKVNLLTFLKCINNGAWLYGFSSVWTGYMVS